MFCGKKNSDKLERLQERAIRFVYNDYCSTYESLLKRANLLHLSTFRLRFLAIEVYRCMNNMNPKYLNEMFTSRDCHYNLRNKDLVQQQRFKTYKFGYKSFQYYGAKLWNALPPEVKAAGSLNIFKHRITAWLHSTLASLLEIS